MRPLTPTARRSRIGFLLSVAAVVVLAPGAARAHGPRDLPSEDKSAPATDTALSLPSDWFSLHYQFTAATQYHPSFSAKYSGQNSLSPESENASAFVTTLFADLRLWRGAELLFNPESSLYVFSLVDVGQ